MPGSNTDPSPSATNGRASRPFGPSQPSGSARRLDNPHLLSRVALLLGMLTVLASTLVGVAAYVVSLRSVKEQALESNRALVQLLKRHVDLHADGGKELRELEQLWESVRPLYDGSYLCAVGKDGALTLHTAHPQTVGNDVGGNRISNPGGPESLGELVESSKSWAGFYVSSAGEDQIAAFEPTSVGLLAVHVPMRSIEERARRQILPWIVGLVFVVFVMLPLCLFLMYRSFVTSQKILSARESQLRHALKMEAVGQLAGGVAHDFNNLLQVILANTDLLRAHLPKPDERRDYVSEIERASNRASELTSRLLAFGRKQILQRTACELNEVVRELSKMLRRLLREDLELRLELDRQPLLLHADRGQLEQVIINLCVNARDAMPDGGVLTLETAAVEQEGNDFVVLRCRDTGGGIAPEVQSRVFEPFFTTKEPGAGTGLGLSMVAGVVEQHGGWVRVISEPGEGSTFELYLPRHPDPPEEVSELVDTPSLPTPESGSETVLLCEDDENIRLIVGRVLERSGYRVLTAAHGAEAVEMAQREDVALAILDLVMPVLGGVEAYRKLRKVAPRTRVLFITGYTTEAADLPANVPVLLKPFRGHALLAKIREILDGEARSHPLL